MSDAFLKVCSIRETGLKILKKIIVIEPYYGGSHRAFLRGLQDHLPCRFELHTMPARMWKWRMRLAAPCFAERISRGEIEVDGAAMILCSSFLDVATFIGLLPAVHRDIPVLTYFHENQFAYPVQLNDTRDFHFTLTNLTTALASQRIAFNSSYNFDSFLDGCAQIMKKNYDMDFAYEAMIRAKATILYPGQDFSEIDRCAALPEREDEPVILWNHRWEHDKNPEFFFQSLFALAGKNISFKLIVVGESFRMVPEIFAEAEKKLADRIIHFGYVRSRSEYIRYLQQADVVVSTANHEFFGIAVVEAVRAGCRPLLPNRLSYRELFSAECLYEDHEFQEKLTAALLKGRLTAVQARTMTEKFSWRSLCEEYQQWLQLT